MQAAAREAGAGFARVGEVWVYPRCGMEGAGDSVPLPLLLGRVMSEALPRAIEGVLVADAAGAAVISCLRGDLDAEPQAGGNAEALFADWWETNAGMVVAFQLVSEQTRRLRDAEVQRIRQYKASAATEHRDPPGVPPASRPMLRQRHEADASCGVAESECGRLEPLYLLSVWGENRVVLQQHLSGGSLLLTVIADRAAVDEDSLCDLGARLDEMLQPLCAAWEETQAKR
ncbi:hypothetical protein CDCA_CDCA01G0238 [Cyanidium caldarium]|uniref:Uncharacterized protein n=1 Tax=Cyanidium caldarium TaxID=2771 RepID=A0AAV9IQH1_CYACA|nr:hypothetical protein CDCA_CDCA01G0238 [Cyanidium caldarium]|eukprot:ctg_808.g279